MVDTLFVSDLNVTTLPTSCPFNALPIGDSIEILLSFGSTSILEIK